MSDFEYFETNYTQLLPANKTARILDFGCGHGVILKFLKSRGFINLFGADIIEYDTWADLSTEGIEIKKIEDSASYLASVKGQFDFIIVKDVIYYFGQNEVVPIVKLLKAALKPGGKILFDIINGSMITGAYTKYKDFDIRLVLNEHSIVSIAEKAGLQITYLKGNVISVTGVRSFIYLIINYIHQKFVSLLYFAERGSDSQNPHLFSKKIIAVTSGD